MITGSRKIGLIGEMRAAQYLRKKGYSICSANFKSKTGEIDIIALKDNILCFIEVKTREYGVYFQPSEAVDYRKEESIKSTAAYFIEASKLKMNVRFDIIEVIICDDKFKINHIENAF